MATKKECDRCKKQWTPQSHRFLDNGKDYELCNVSVNIPYDRNQSKEIEVIRAFELCQACARAVYELILTAPKSKRRGND